MANKKHLCLSASFFLRGTGAKILIYLSISLGASFTVGLPCESKAVAAKADEGEVVLECPLDADVSKTKHSVVIKHFDSNFNYTGEVLGCDWLGSTGDFDCSFSRFGAKLLKIQADRVLARLPGDRVQQDGYYRCQLVPSKSDHPFKDCKFICPEASKEISTTAVPSAVDHHKTDAPKDLSDPRSYGPDVQDFKRIREKLTAAVVVLSIIVTILFLLILAATIRLRSECRKHRDALCPEKKGRHEPGSHQTGQDGQQSQTNIISSSSFQPLMSDSAFTSLQVKSI